MNTIVASNYETLSDVAAKMVIEVINKKPNAVIGLATGSTPIGLYETLIAYHKKGVVDFSDVTSFNLDEYVGLSESHPQSFRYFMDSNFFSHININPKNTHIPNGMAKDIALECKNYDAMLEASNGIDIQILGIGTNGHIGFNEPNDALILGTHVATLAKETIIANSRFFNAISEVPTRAITMGIGNIMRAKKIVVLASGSEKSDIIKELFDDKVTTQVPVSLLKIHPDVTIIVDELAGKFINS
jgi:glucosamine-6-phosphate deaminase